MSTSDHVMDALTLSSTVPMLPSFMTSVWSALWQHLFDISHGSDRDIYVTVGPIYDINNNNHRDYVDEIER